jgi:hypothetical protein
MALTDFAEAAILNHVYRGVALPTLNANNTVELYTVAPTDSSAGTPATGTGYAPATFARNAGNWAAPSARATSNAAAISFGTAGGSWGTVVAGGIKNGSDLWLYGAVSPAQPINLNDPVSYAIGDFTWTITGAMSTWLADAVLNWLLRGVAFPALAADNHTSLHTGAPGLTGANETTGGSYARVVITRNTGTFTVPGAPGSISNVNQLTFPAPSADWGIQTAAGTWNGSNFLMNHTMSQRTVNNGNPAPYIAVGALTVAID